MSYIYLTEAEAEEVVLQKLYKAEEGLDETTLDYFVHIADTAKFHSNMEDEIFAGRVKVSKQGDEWAYSLTPAGKDHTEQLIKSLGN